MACVSIYGKFDTSLINLKFLLWSLSNTLDAQAIDVAPVYIYFLIKPSLRELLILSNHLKGLYKMDQEFLETPTVDK